MAYPFDRAAYLRAPVITVSTGVTLVFALLDACPEDASPAVKKAAKKLKVTAEKARDALAERNRLLGTYTEEDSRDLDNEADRAWGGARMALQARAMLPHDKFPKAKRAAELDTLLFAGGMEFLKAEYSSQSTTMGAILRRIDEDGLGPEIDSIIGADFLVAMRDVQPRYEAMASERLRRDKATGQNLLEMTRGLQAAIVDYATKVVATIEEDDAATIEAVRLALLPLANFRENAASRAPRTPEEPPAPPPPAKQPE